MIDVHSHIQFKAFNKERDSILKEMQEKNIRALVVGTSKDTSEAAVNLSKQYNFLYPTVGIHPLEEKGSIEEVLHLVGDAVAIGECGFDYTRVETEEELKFWKEIQMVRFHEHAKVAAENKLPMMMHIRTNKEDIDTDKDAHKDFIKEFKIARETHPDLHCHIHFYTEARVAEELIELGCTFSFSGVITFVREYKEAVKKIPLDKLMTETDCPFAAPEPKRRTKNSSLNVIHIAEKIANIKGVDVDEVISQTDINADRVFNLAQK